MIFFLLFLVLNNRRNHFYCYHLGVLKVVKSFYGFCTNFRMFLRHALVCRGVKVFYCCLIINSKNYFLMFLSDAQLVTKTQKLNYIRTCISIFVVLAIQQLARLSLFLF